MAQTAGNLGIFEGTTDVGSPSHKGIVTYNTVTKEYRVTGGGANMWAGRDDFFFVWKKITGDLVMTATVKIVSSGNNHRKAALVLRKDLEPGSVYADAVVHGDGLTALQWREKADDVTRTIHFPISGPTQLRIQRNRNVVTLYAAKEGGPLMQMGNTEMATFSPLYVGLAVCAHDDSAETTVVFSDVRIDAVAPISIAAPGK